jgi:hypothetical protein
MKISKFGGLIAAASKKSALPLLQVGSIPIIKSYESSGAGSYTLPTRGKG